MFGSGATRQAWDQARLPSGDTLICASMHGRIFPVTLDGKRSGSTSNPNSTPMAPTARRPAAPSSTESSASSPCHLTGHRPARRFPNTLLSRPNFQKSALTDDAPATGTGPGINLAIPAATRGSKVGYGSIARQLRWQRYSRGSSVQRFWCPANRSVPFEGRYFQHCPGEISGQSDAVVACADNPIHHNCASGVGGICGSLRPAVALTRLML